MNKITKSLILIFAILSLLVTLVACGGTTPSTDGETTGGDVTTGADTTGGDVTTGGDTTGPIDTTETPLPQTNFVALVEASQSRVSIVYPKDYTADEINVAAKLSSFIKSACGVAPTVMPDNVNVPDGQMQILIGDTARTDEAHKRASLEIGEYIIDVADGKVTVNAHFSDSLYYTLEVIEAEITKYANYKQGELYMPETVEGTGLVAPLSKDYFKIGSIDMFDAYECGDQCYMLLFNKTTKSTFDEYVALLATMGLTEREAPRNIIGGPRNISNYYAMYANDDTVATVLYTGHNHQLRVFLERTATTAYASYVNDNTADVCEPLLIQVGIGKTQNSGMSYIFRFSNGEFFIYDGGFNDGSYKEDANCRRIVALLKQYAPDPNNIRIAGWLITHPHIDHIGAFDYFCNTYLDDDTITLENLLINNPASTVADQDTSSDNLADKIMDYRKSIDKAVADGTAIHKLHPGQKYAFGNDAELEILYTHELRMPDELGASNNLSVVSRFTVEGQTYLITGDTHTHSNRVFTEMYSGGYQSDFYQAAHHGWGSNTEAFVKGADPKWVLWPCGTGRIEETAKKEHNLYLFSDASRVEGIFYAENKTTVFHLPFDGTNYTVTENEPIVAAGPKTDADGYILIYNLGDLLAIKDDLEAKYRLASDIMVDGTYMVASNRSALYGAQNSFAGILDGAGHTIDFSEASITYAKGGSVLFQTIVGGTVKNLNITGVNIVSNADGGCQQAVLCLWGEDITFSNVHVEAKYSQTTEKAPNIGAFVGKVTKATTIDITDCSVKWNASSYKGHFGGFVGAAATDGCTVNITNCVATGTAHFTAGSAAGFVGNASGGNANVTSCVNKMNITAVNAGGMVAYAGGASNVTIFNCTNEGTIQTVAATGSIAGSMMATSLAASTVTIRKCTNNGIVTYGVAPADETVHLGEMFGWVEESVGAKITVSDCTNNGKVE